MVLDAAAHADSVRVALVQLRVDGDESAQQRMVEVAREVARAADDGAQIVILPELWTCGAFDVEAGLPDSETVHGPISTALAELAAEHNIWLHGGSILATNGDTASLEPSVYNTALLFDPAGSLVTVYRKIHLFGFDTGEAVTLGAGTELALIDTPLGRTGLATCYDLRFPELFRALSAAGAEAVLLCSSWPLARIAHWRTLVTARAIENQFPVLACNAIGTHNAVTLGGESMVVDATGMQLAMARHDETLLMTTLHPDVTRAARVDFPVLRDRKL